MTVKLIKTNISKQTLKFKPGDSPAAFAVTVVNDSDKFSSFQIEVLAAGADTNIAADWYIISPGVSAKTPPGDSITFCVTIIDTPVAGFVGKMNLTVCVFSPELRHEDRQLLRLEIQPGIGSIPVHVELIVREFQTQPEELIEIPVRVFNPSQLATNVTLQFSNLEPSWLLNGAEKKIPVGAGAKIETTFLCQLPATENAPSQAYQFIVTATHPNAPPSHTQGVIKVLPGGYVEFRCLPTQQQLPEARMWLPQWKVNTATYQLEFHNASNLTQEVSVDVTKAEDQPKCTLEVIPEVENLNPGQTKQLELIVTKPRPWFGLPQKLVFEAKSQVSDQKLDVRNDTQILRLKILPVLPIWLQLLSACVFLILAWWLSWLNPNNPFFGHSQAVYSVQLNGLGDMAASGSQDQNIIRWRMAGFTNPFINQEDGKVANSQAVGKAVRVVRYKPVDNDLIAAGLENGEIQLWNVVGNANTPRTTLIKDQADRVLDLKFTPDSQYLFSGHGSGLVLQWDVNSALASRTTTVKKPVEIKPVNFAIYSLALVGERQENLVIAGQRHTLWMWNWKQQQSWQLSYSPQGSQNDYITSLASSPYKPNLMASADNNGQITLWNMQPCLSQNGKCEVLQQWSDGHGGKPVRSLALSQDGCYLVSGGNDNRLLLWSLQKDGRLASTQGQEIRTASKQFNSVDVKVVNNKILIISGNDDTQVWFNSEPLDLKSQCSQSGKEEK